MPVARSMVAAVPGSARHESTEAGSIMSEILDMNKGVIEEFRANGGVCTGWLVGL